MHIQPSTNTSVIALDNSSGNARHAVAQAHKASLTEGHGLACLRGKGGE